MTQLLLAALSVASKSVMTLLSAQYSQSSRAYFRELIQGDGDVVDDDEAMQLLRRSRQGCEQTGLELMVEADCSNNYDFKSLVMVVLGHEVIDKDQYLALPRLPLCLLPAKAGSVLLSPSILTASSLSVVS